MRAIAGMARSYQWAPGLCKPYSAYPICRPSHQKSYTPSPAARGPRGLRGCSFSLACDYKKHNFAIPSL